MDFMETTVLFRVLIHTASIVTLELAPVEGVVTLVTEVMPVNKVHVTHVPSVYV